MRFQFVAIFLLIAVFCVKAINLQDSLPMNANYKKSYNAEVEQLLQLEHGKGSNNLELPQTGSYYSGPSAFAVSASMFWLLYNRTIYKYNLNGILQNKIVCKDAIDFTYCDSSLFVYGNKRLLHIDFDLNVIKIKNLEDYKVKDYGIGGVSAFWDKYFFLNEFSYKNFYTIPRKVIALNRWGATDSLSQNDSIRLNYYGCRNCSTEFIHGFFTSSAKKEYLGESIKFLVYAYRQEPFNTLNVRKPSALQYFVLDKKKMEVQPFGIVINKELKGLRLDQTCLRPVTFENDSSAVFQVIGPGRNGNVGVFYYKIVFHSTADN